MSVSLSMFDLQTDRFDDVWRVAVLKVVLDSFARTLLIGRMP